MFSTPRVSISLAKIACAAALACALGGCAERQTPAVAAADAASAVRNEGLVRIADVMTPVVPFVIHDPKQDLFTLCQIGSQAAREAGGELPLCYDPAPRGRDAIAVARVEIIEASLGRALQSVAASGDGAHFAVDRTGTIYQVLDLAYAARRDGAARRDEIRVISTAPEAHRDLLATLERLWPKLRVEVITVHLPRPAPPPALAPPPSGDPR